MRVLFLRSNPIAPDPRVEKEAKSLVQAGYEVTLLGWDRTAQLPPSEWFNGIVCYRLQIRSEYARGMANLPALLHWQWRLLFWLCKHHHEYDIIHACDFDTLLPAYLCKIIWGKKIVYDIFDFYADHLRATPQLIKKLIRIIDLSFISRVDGLILADDSRWEQIKGKKPKLSKVIYNSPQDLFENVVIAEKGGKLANLNIAYVGLLQVERGLLEMLEILGRHPKWKLELAGYGGDQERILLVAKELPNVIWHGRISYEDALQLYRNADVIFATYDPSIPNHKYSSPNKLFEAMMLAKPIIVARGTNMDKIVEEADCGLVVEYGDIPALESALLRLQEAPQLRVRLERNARSAYLSSYSWVEMQHRLLELYDTLSGKAVE